jgi:hypothetical protein
MRYSQSHNQLEHLSVFGDQQQPFKVKVILFFLFGEYKTDGIARSLLIANARS